MDFLTIGAHWLGLGPSVATWALFRHTAAMEAQVSRVIVEGVVALAKDLGLSTSILSQHVNVDWLPRKEYFELWDELDRLRPGVGLTLSASAQDGQFGILDFLARNAPTLRVAVYELIKHLALVYQGPQVELKIEGETASLIFLDVGGSRPAEEFGVAFWTTLLRRLAGGFQPTLVRMQFAKPPHVAIYQQVFGCPIEFSATVTATEFATSSLDATNVAANPHLYSILRSYVIRDFEKLMEMASPNDGMLTLVRREVASQLGSGKPQRDQIAASLRMSGSTLQRRLMKESGLSFGTVVDQVRNELACRYLQDSSVSVGEIALTLGFSDTSNFVRAFRKWMDLTPGEFRSQKT